MNKLICRMAMVLAVASLTGCGLKGPLYFPPEEKPTQQTEPATTPTADPAAGDEQNLQQLPTTDSQLAR